MNSNFYINNTNRERVFVFLVALTFISYILSYALTNIAIFSFIGFFFWDTKHRIKEKINSFKTNKLVIIYTLFFLIQVIGYFYSSNKTVASRQIEIMLPIFFLPAILSVEKMTKVSFYKIMNCLKYIILLIFSYYLIIHIFIDYRKLNSFVHFTINEKFGISQVFMAFILLIPVLETFRKLQDRQQLYINSSLFLVSIFFIFLLGNKTMLLFISLLLGWFFYRININKKVLKGLLLVLFMGLSFTVYKTSILKERIDVVLKTTDLDLKTIITKNKYTITKNTLEHRLLINHLALIEIKKALPFGVGTGDFQEKLNNQYKRVGFKFGISEELNTHNQYFAEFLKTGVLGGFLFIILIFMLLKESYKLQNYTFPIVLLFAIGSIVETYLSRQHGVDAFAFIIPFFLWNEKK